MFKLFKKHYLIIILALVIGALTFLPQIFAAQKVENFQGIYKSINNDEPYYLARARDIIDGHYNLANPYLYEYKDGQAMQFWLPDYILAKPLALLGINNIHHGYIFYDFLLPFILTILSYSIIFLLTRSIPISFLAASFLHLNLFLYIFSRAPSPQLNFIFWLLLFLFWLKFLEKGNYKYAILTGLSFGLLFHVYTYYWTFYLVFFVIFIFLNFILKQKISYKKYLIIFGVAFIIGIPYFISMIKSLSLPYYSESLARVGMVDTHFPTGRKIVMWGAIILILLFISYRKKIININYKTLFLTSGTLASIVVVNQQVITGKNLQFASHYWMLSVFIFIFTLSYLAGKWLKNIKSKHIAAIILTIAFIYVFYSPAFYIDNIFAGEAVKYSAQEIDSQRYAEIFNWLNRNTKKDEVVFADVELSSLIPIYTANNVYSIGNASLHFMPTEELQERFVINNYWDDMDSQYAVEHKFSIWGSYHQTAYDINITKNKLRRVFGLPRVEYVKIPQADIDKFLEFVREIKNKNFGDELKKYKVDYFVWDKEKDKNWQVENLEFLEPIAEANNILIYKVN